MNKNKNLFVLLLLLSLSPLLLLSDSITIKKTKSNTMPSIQFLPNFPERPTNPARTNIFTGDIGINAQRWAQLTSEEREFVLQHEIGHYKNHTFNEITADRYALKKIAGKKPYSLINYLNAVSKISYNNPQRVQAAQFDTLQIAANKGSKKAQQMLKQYANADGLPEKRQNLKDVKPEDLPLSNNWIWLVVLLGGLIITFSISE